MRSVCFFWKEVSSPETTGYVVVDEVAFLIEQLVRLCYDIVILFISCHVDNIVGNTRGLARIALVYDTVRSLNEAVLVYPNRIACEG